VSPDVGLFNVPEGMDDGLTATEIVQSRCLQSPLSFPTTGTITVVFSRS
jgi:hypothetical protein